MWAKSLSSQILFFNATAKFLLVALLTLTLEWWVFLSLDSSVVGSGSFTACSLFNTLLCTSPMVWCHINLSANGDLYCVHVFICLGKTLQTHQSRAPAAGLFQSLSSAGKGGSCQRAWACQPARCRQTESTSYQQEWVCACAVCMKVVSLSDVLTFKPILSGKDTDALRHLCTYELPVKPEEMQSLLCAENERKSQDMALSMQCVECDTFSFSRLQKCCVEGLGTGCTSLWATTRATSYLWEPT